MNSNKRAEIIRNRVVIDQAELKGFKGRDIVTDAEVLRGLVNLESQQLRAGKLTRGRLANLRFQIDEYELLAGRILPEERTEEEIKQAQEFMQTVSPSGGQSGHCALYWEELFDIGIGGLINKIASKNTETHQSFVDALLGIQEMIANAMKPVEDALKTASPKRAGELQLILDSCKRINHDPPKTFRDAIQLVWFVVIGTMIGDKIGYVCPGMLDRHFARFIEESDNFKAEALAILEAYYFLLNDFTHAGGASAILVGGIDEAGNNVTNVLSFLCLEALRRTNLVYPTVGVCWHNDTPDDLTNLAVELISKGYATPAFFGDKVIRTGLMEYGLPEAEACDYQNSTCVEITPYGSSNVWVASPYFSLCGILMEKFADNVKHDSYDDFLEAYFSLLGEKIAHAVTELNKVRERRRLYNRNPLQSVFTLDCIERGRDIDDGGARYNWIECSFVGLANLIDSLKVIKEEVYEARECSLAELKQVLDSDFADNEQLRQKLLNKYPKYGLNDASVDAEITKLMNFITSECAKHKMLPDNAHFIPGTFCWVMHQRLGAECSATPDGRKAGFPFADGAGPAQGREKLGPTAAINSVTSWNHSPMIGGSAFNMKFNRAVFNSPGAVEKLKQLIIVFLRQGGFETQINVVDNDLLKQALATPEEYNDLVVRIGGYTDYFTRMTPEMQQEVIQRTEYDAI
jgi:trans-4-hydroxy-L-proline dehydratase